MNLPYIKNIDTVSELMDVLGNKTEYGKRLKVLHELETLVNARLKSYSDYQDVQKFLNLANAKMTEAKEKEQKAAQLVSTAREDADKIVGEALEKRAQVEATNKKETAALEKRATELQLKEADLVKREKEAQDTMAAATALDARAREMLRQQETLSAELERRLKRVQEAASA